MATVALLSAIGEAGRGPSLARLRSHVAARGDVFHYEVDDPADLDEALRHVARVRPAVIAVNGDDAAVAAVIGAVGRAWGADAPALALLPRGDAGRLAREVGTPRCPLAAIERARAIAARRIVPQLVRRRPILVATPDGTTRIGLVLRGGASPRKRALSLRCAAGRAIGSGFAFARVTTLLGRTAAEAPMMSLTAVSAAVPGRLRLLCAGLAERFGPLGLHRRDLDGVEIGDAEGLMLDGTPLAADQARATPGAPVSFVDLRSGGWSRMASG